MKLIKFQGEHLKDINNEPLLQVKVISLMSFFVIIHHCSYSSVKDKGVVHLYINKWIEVTFCLPHKVHSKSSAALSVKVNVSVYTTYGMCICHND